MSAVTGTSLGLNKLTGWLITVKQSADHTKPPQPDKGTKALCMAFLKQPEFTDGHYRTALGLAVSEIKQALRTNVKHEALALLRNKIISKKLLCVGAPLWMRWEVVTKDRMNDMDSTQLRTAILAAYEVIYAVHVCTALHEDKQRTLTAEGRFDQTLNHGDDSMETQQAGTAASSDDLDAAMYEDGSEDGEIVKVKP